MKLPALLLIHGYPFDHTLWDHVVALLGSDAPVLAPDLRGFGGTPAGTEAPSLDVMADDLVKLLDKEDIGRAVVAGMSMGGYIALSFAEHWKDRLAGLGLISTQVQADSEETRANRRAVIERVRSEGTGAASTPLLPKMFSPRNSGKAELTRFPIQGAEKAGVDGVCWALEAMAQRPDRTETLRQVQVPVLVLHGADDQLVPLARAEAMSQLASDSVYRVVPGAGHATPLEAPETVATALRELLQRAASMAAS